ncbi:hypothetical protein cand_026020 [Cryptosporidium andersoni]|uniref:Uncharacterized protein n=1 Tax=Cryptosporidium andersoni TaxID=117008 RepID=A0A1J4MAE0_9CRYT|nr:hypothetical protein cand_026020 [Cryptosporidium andersoni]
MYKVESKSNLGEAYNNITRLFETVSKESTTEAINCINSIIKDTCDKLSLEDHLLEYRDGNGRNVCHFVCSASRSDTLRALLKLAPKLVNSLDGSGESPLFLSVRAEDIECINILLENGADVSLLNNKNCNVLHYACETSNYEVLGILLSSHNIQQYSCVDLINQCSPEFGTPLQWACMRNNLKIAKFLLLLGANPNIYPVGRGIPPCLILASSLGNIDMVETLINSGALVKLAIDSEGYTALYCAVEGNNFDLIKLLVHYSKEQKFDIFSVSVNGKDIYIYAQEQNCSHEILEYLEDFVSNNENVTSVTQCLLNTSQEMISDKVVLNNSDDEDLEEHNISESDIDEDNSDSDIVYDEEEAKKIKSEGNLAFSLCDYNSAIQAYTDALNLLKRKVELLSKEGIDLKSSLLSNRCWAYIQVKEYNKALLDAKSCIKVKPEWSKGYFRLSQAYQHLNDSENQAYSLWDAVIHEVDSLETKQQYLSILKNLIEKKKNISAIYPREQI